ncbi:sensor histidine kinase [Cohnella faecalis]|uniref:histidine kinase n=1 Tax=Cohnella faecalis TaxID=2315694 RepID=A0A398CQQ3_9BACL|nr:HAMP domain-containing sensor histidine kinase [Cohnella faecalis]RIE04832.1 sensor histidine kinase [Cohnella faecalis]
MSRRRSGESLLKRFRDKREARRERMLAFQEEYFRTQIRNKVEGSNDKVPARPKRWLFFGLAMVYVVMLANYLFAQWLMTFVYDYWFPEMGHTIGRQLITVVLMLFIFGLMMTLIRVIFDPGRHQLHLFISMMDAMRRMAKGDFSVTLDSNPRHGGQFGVLIKSFNEMASGLSNMEKVRQEFISNVSHEFQSPLTSIGGFARALQSEDLTPETRLHYLRIIETECSRLSKLSDNLLKLTSLESDHHPFEPKSFRLDRQLRQIVLSIEPIWRDKKLEMDVDLPAATIEADEELLSQTWINLLHNAIKFTPEGGTVRIRLTENERHLRIVIEDTGVGIAEQSLPYLFDRFYKVDKARSRVNGGSGLGLSIVRKIVELHGGEVSVHSRPMEGAAFTVVLPKLASSLQAPVQKPGEARSRLT